MGAVGLAQLDGSPFAAMAAGARLRTTRFRANNISKMTQNEPREQGSAKGRTQARGMSGGTGFAVASMGPG